MSFNQATIIGNLGGDVDSKFTQGGTAVSKFSVATSEQRKDKEGNKTEITTWHRVTAFGKLGEICARYLSKGSKVFVQGRIHNDKYDKDGVTHYTSEIIADTVRMLDKRPEGESRQEAPPRDGGGGRNQAQQQAPMDDFKDDDIPFNDGSAP